MATEKANQNPAKSQIFNLIIIDKSGSMSSIQKEALTGLNETLESIRAARRAHPDQEQFVTLVAFCSCGRQHIYDNTPIEQCANLREDQYIPCCCTPLYDAIGEACNRIKAIVAGRPMASVSVTIITDGYENASREFSHSQIATLINQLKEEGWLFAYIGADHDVNSVAFSIHIENTMAFEKSSEGTAEMFKRERNSRQRWYDKMHAVSLCCADSCLSDDEINAKKRSLNSKYFDK